MKHSLLKALSRGHNYIRVTGTFRPGKHGHVVFDKCVTPYGTEDHIWANRVAVGQLPPLKDGSRISFIASLQKYKKRDGTTSVRLEDIREPKVVEVGK